MRDFGIISKVTASLSNSEFDAILVAGPGNTQYLSGTRIPFHSAWHDQHLFVLWPREKVPRIICPAEWETSVRKTSWMSNIHVYTSHSDDPSIIIAEIARIFKSTQTKVIGLDTDSISHRVVRCIETTLPQIQIGSCDELLANQRMVKTPEEVIKLSDVAMRTDHAINGCVHHITVDRRMSELTFAEELRIHSIERGIEIVGYNACSRVSSAKELVNFWPCPPKFGYSMTKDLKRGDTVRIELYNMIDGYWSDAARMMVMEQDISEIQDEGYNSIVTMREILIDLLKPGARCNDVFTSAVSHAEKEGIPLMTELGLGHGIGVQPVEPPYLNAGDTTELQENMVLVLDPVVKTAEGIYRSKDTVAIRKNGPEIVNWYKDWREPYTPIMSI